MRVPAVSDWPVLSHLEHICRADQTIIEVLERIADGKIRDRGGGPTFAGRVVQWTGRIPRGKANAPQPVVPMGLEHEEVTSELHAVKARLTALDPRLTTLAASRATSAHPILGHFTAREWLRFIAVHHGHHERIVRDILDA